MHVKKIFRPYVNSNPVLLMTDLPVCFLSHTRMLNTRTVAQQISMSPGVPLVSLLKQLETPFALHSHYFYIYLLKCDIHI